MIATVLIAFLALLMGSIPSGLILGRLISGQDVRSVGSGNIGAANVSRMAGARVGALVLVADMVKGWVPVMIGRADSLSAAQLAVVAGVAVLGHDFSIFLRFRGGKGVATTLGVTLALVPICALIAAGAWILLVLAKRYSSLASLTALWTVLLADIVLRQPAAYSFLAVALAALGTATHRENIQRLIDGSERRIGSRSTA
jgi:glycerol-3-phosphate acyltransferase PlsY